MKILALIDVAPDAPIETIRTEIVTELQQSWKLFASGVLREAYATAIPRRVVFVLEADNTIRAHEHLHELPLIAAGLLNFELVELRPFVNWATLFAT